MLKKPQNQGVTWSNTDLDWLCHQCLSNAKANLEPPYSTGALLQALGHGQEPSSSPKLTLEERWARAGLRTDLTSPSTGLPEGLKDGIILCTRMNKLQLGSIPKTNRSTQKWHQLENLSNFFKARGQLRMNPVDLFEANSLFEAGTWCRCRCLFLALARKAKTRDAEQHGHWHQMLGELGMRLMMPPWRWSSASLGSWWAPTNVPVSRALEPLLAPDCHLYDPQNHILPPWTTWHQPPDEHRKQVGQAEVDSSGSREPATCSKLQRQPNVTIPPCPCRWATRREPAKWSGLWPGPADTWPQVLPSRPSGSNRAPATARGPGPGGPQVPNLYYRKRRAPETPMWVVFPHHCPI